MQALPAQSVSSCRPPSALAPLSARAVGASTGHRLQNSAASDSQARHPPCIHLVTSSRGRRHEVRPAAAAAAAQGAATASPAKRVVITGGSRGLGFAMAQQFLAAGDSVAITGRNAERLAAAVEALQEECGDAARVHGLPADSSSPKDMERLGQWVKERLGGVDIWLNNAGEVTAKRLLADVAAEEVVRVVGTNVVGSLLGCRQAVALMREQPGAGAAAPRYHIYNFGFSPWGAKFTQSAATHKSTKRALAQLNESLARELTEAGLTGIGVHNLSPGMLLTDLLLKDSTPAARRFFNALAEEPETVAATLVPRVRAAAGTGSSIDFLTPADALLRVLRGLPQIINGGRFFDKAGQRVAAPGEQYQENGVRVQVRRRQPTQAR